VILATPAFAQPQPTSSADTHNASIQGTTFGANHQALSGAKLLLTERASNLAVQPAAASERKWYEATSDTFGNFSFSGVNPGSYTLIATHSGYEPFDLILNRLLNRLPALTLTAGQQMTGLDIELAPLAALSGKVTDEDGNPMQDVTVTSLRPGLVANGRLRVENDKGSEVRTGPGGEYQLTVETGRWVLAFSPPNQAARTTRGTEPERQYVTTYYPGVRELSMALGIDVAAGQQLPELNVRLQKTTVHYVRGRVHGNIPADLRIGALPETGMSFGDEGQRVNPDGTFEIDGLVPGTWVLLLVQPSQLAYFGRQAVHVGNDDVDDAAIDFQQPVDLSGAVRIAPDQPGSGRSPINAGPLSEIRLFPLDPFPYVIGASVAGDGTFHLNNVDVGRYRVEVTPPPGGFVKTIMFDGLDRVDTGIDVHGSNSSLQIVVSMTAGQIAGTVTNPDGGAPGSATVTLVPDRPPGAVYRPELNLTANAGPNGQFILKNVAPGNYRVYAWERLPPLPPTNEPVVFADPAFPRLFDDMSATVTIAESESKQVSLSRISATRMDDVSRRLR
jgi:hypothetical protein